MQATSLLDGFSFDLFPPFENGLTAPEVDVSRRQVVQALVVSAVVVVPDELLDALFELSCAAALARTCRRGDRMTRLTWSNRDGISPPTIYASDRGRHCSVGRTARPPHLGRAQLSRLTPP